MFGLKPASYALILKRLLVQKKQSTTKRTEHWFLMAKVLKEDEKGGWS